MPINIDRERKHKNATPKDGGAQHPLSVGPVPDVPWLQARRGRANIVGFFESMAPLRITRFEPHTIFDGGDKVFVLINSEATPRDKSYSFPNHGHLWQFNAAGKVVKYDHVTDTAQMIRMAKGE